MYYNEAMDISSEQVCQDLLGLIGKFKSGLARLSEGYELTVMQIHALYAIKHGDVTMGRVAETLHCDASNVTGIVDRLVAGQFITRQEGELDRRTKTLQLTAKGHRAIDDIYSHLPAQLGCDRLTATERSSLHDLATSSSPKPPPAHSPLRPNSSYRTLPQTLCYHLHMDKSVEADQPEASSFSGRDLAAELNASAQPESAVTPELEPIDGSGLLRDFQQTFLLATATHRPK